MPPQIPEVPSIKVVTSDAPILIFLKWYYECEFFNYYFICSVGSMNVHITDGYRDRMCFPIWVFMINEQKYQGKG